VRRVEFRMNRHQVFSFNLCRLGHRIPGLSEGRVGSKVTWFTSGKQCRLLAGHDTAIRKISPAHDCPTGTNPI
jgi:hypothetical protein